MVSAGSLGFAYKGKIQAKRSMDSLGDHLFTECLNNHNMYINAYTWMQVGNFMVSLYEMNFH
jgi:hypothetical protein